VAAEAHDRKAHHLVTPDPVNGEVDVTRCRAGDERVGGNLRGGDREVVGKHHRGHDVDVARRRDREVHRVGRGLLRVRWELAEGLGEVRCRGGLLDWVRYKATEPTTRATAMSAATAGPRAT